MKYRYRKILSLILLGIMLGLLPACGAAADKQDQGLRDKAQDDSPNQELLISAAASLQEVLAEIGRDYERQKPEVKLTFNFAASGTLQRQIEQGAPVDLFISAGTSQLEALEDKGLLIPGTKIDLLGNELVLITTKENHVISGLQDLVKTTVSKIALGIPETSPAGSYSREALEKAHLWEPLKDKYILAKDVKQIVTYVETENVDAGFVYLSDTVDLGKIKVIKLPADLHSPIVYPAAIIKETKNKEKAEDFLNYLQTAAAREIFLQYGFRMGKSS